MLYSAFRYSKCSKNVVALLRVHVNLTGQGSNKQKDMHLNLRRMPQDHFSIYSIQIFSMSEFSTYYINKQYVFPAKYVEDIHI